MVNIIGDTQKAYIELFDKSDKIVKESKDIKEVKDMLSQVTGTLVAEYSKHQILLESIKNQCSVTRMKSILKEQNERFIAFLKKFTDVSVASDEEKVKELIKGEVKNEV